jgi:hypothetical protein
MFDPFGINNHINSMLNGMLMDPFMTPQQRQQMSRQQQQQQQQMGGGGNGGGSNQQLQLHRSNLFNNDPFSIVSPFERHHQHHMQHHSPFGPGGGNPFSLMHQMMPNMDSLFRNFETNLTPNIVNADPNSQVFSSSSVITYSNGDGKPKVFQQSKQMRQGPGGIKETREIVRDSEKGIEQLAIGHHIGDRAHIIERKKARDGNIEEVVNLENLDDEEVNEFNKEFEERIGAQYRSTHNHGHHHRTHHHLNNNHPFAIEDGSKSSKKEKDRKTKSKH